MTLDIDPVAIPLEERIDGQSVAKAMQTRSVRVAGTTQADLVRYLDERPSQHVIRHARSTVGEEKVPAIGIAAEAISKLCLALQSALGGRVQRDVSCFAELGIPNRQHAIDEIHIVADQMQCLIGPQTRRDI
jgi:hypothetical protein